MSTSQYPVRVLMRMDSEDSEYEGNIRKYLRSRGGGRPQQSDHRSGKSGVHEKNQHKKTPQTRSPYDDPPKLVSPHCRHELIQRKERSKMKDYVMPTPTAAPVEYFLQHRKLGTATDYDRNRNNWVLGTEGDPYYHYSRNKEVVFPTINKVPVLKRVSQVSPSINYGEVRWKSWGYLGGSKPVKRVRYAVDQMYRTAKGHIPMKKIASVSPRSISATLFRGRY